MSGLLGMTLRRVKKILAWVLAALVLAALAAGAYYLAVVL